MSDCSNKLLEELKKRAIFFTHSNNHAHGVGERKFSKVPVKKKFLFHPKPLCVKEKKAKR